MLLKRDAKCKAKCRSYEKDKNRFRDARVECMLPAYLILTLPCGDDWSKLPGPVIAVRCTSIEEVATQRKKAKRSSKQNTHTLLPNMY